MSHKFVLEIVIGNDAMLNNYDIAGALIDVSIKLKERGVVPSDESMIIRDLNGNTVGKYEIIKE